MDEELKKHVIKTGTTTVGIVCKDGIVVAADKRASYGSSQGVSYIAGRDQEKIQEVFPNIIVTTAGVASDTRKLIRYVKAELRLRELKSRTKPSVKIAANLFSSITYQSIRQPSMIPSIAHFLLSGFDETGFYLFDISPDGYLQEVKDYSATGSGMMQVNPILDSDYKKDLTVKEGVELAKKCINAAIGRDPASGEGMDIYVVKEKELKQIEKKKAVIEFKDEKE